MYAFIMGREPERLSIAPEPRPVLNGEALSVLTCPLEAGHVVIAECHR